jgi:hypothetical protein
MRPDIWERSDLAGDADESSAAPGAELYVYYRVPVAARIAALAQVQHVQTALIGVHAGLQVRCLVRADDAPTGEMTCMEIYRHPRGVDATLQADIDAAMSAWPTQRIGPRHVERFVAA